jgi:hypothetical protein
MPRNGRRTPAASAASAMFLQIASCQMWAGVQVDHGHVLIIIILHKYIYANIICHILSSLLHAWLFVQYLYNDI